MSEHLPTQVIEGFEGLEFEAREAALNHLESCAACRAKWLAQDPLRAFGLLSRVSLPEDVLDRLSSRVATAVDDLEPVMRPARRPWFGAAAIAASMLLAVLVGAVLWTHEIPEAPIVRLDESDLLPALEDEVVGMRLVALPGNETQVLDLTIGDIQVLMIFDESIEL